MQQKYAALATAMIHNKKEMVVLVHAVLVHVCIGLSHASL